MSQSALHVVVQSIERMCGFELLDRRGAEPRAIAHAIERAAATLGR